MAITRDEVLHLAKLSAMKLSDEEVSSLGQDLDSIVGYVWQLKEIDTEGVEPLLQPIPGIVSPLYEGVEPYADPDWLLSQTEHQINHRQIVITSNKAEEN